MITKRNILRIIVLILSVSARANAAELVFPHFAQGGGYLTTFSLTNLSDIAGAATIHLITQSGTPFLDLPVTLPANGTSNLTVGSGALVVGWVRVTTTSAIFLSGSETIQRMAGGSVLAETMVPSATADTAFRFPVTERDTVSTGLALANPGATTARLTVAIRNPSGSVVASTGLPLVPSQQVARFVSEFFRGITPFEGSIQVESSTPITAIAVRQSSSGLFSSLPSVPVTGVSESFFSPNGGIFPRILQEIQRAQISIDIAMYSFTRDAMTDALIAAKSRGVSIRVITDSGQAPQAGSEIARLESLGVPLKRIPGSGNAIMHNKYAIFDSRVLLTGSYNWSETAETRNFENAIFIREFTIVNSYQANFNSIWNNH